MKQDSLFDLVVEADDGQVKHQDPYYRPRGTYFPTMGYAPQHLKKVQAALVAHDCEALRRLHVKWYDQYAQRWFYFTPSFWKVNELDWSDCSAWPCDHSM